ncbi:hypothetical protein V1Y59_19210 [Gordonia sp. PKS22-38]|uniref:Mce-associated membrane protein n=1 Tax=Gordonia prachuapensis TaxID=3115651 RepID=A0ABU7MY48_9ACTN|nr:hypothetical protein [Gordonia sp. PKS22-38]
MAESDNRDSAGLNPRAGRDGPVRRAPLRRSRRPAARDTAPAESTTPKDDPGPDDAAPTETSASAEPVADVNASEEQAAATDGPVGAPEDSVGEKSGSVGEDDGGGVGVGEIEADPAETERTLGYRERRRRRQKRPRDTRTTGSPGGVRYRGAKRSRGWIVGSAVCVVVLVTSLVAAVVFALGIGRITDEQDLRQEYSTFARQMVVNLTTLNADNVDDAMKALEDRTSGRAHQQMQESMQQAVSLVRDQDLDTKSTVISDAVTHATPDEGTVILVYGWQMKPENPEEQTIVQTFRWRVQVTRINDDLKMTNFEWVT